MTVKRVVKEEGGYILEVLVNGEVVKFFVKNVREWME